MPFDARAYDRHRPSYPEATLQRLIDGGVLDGVPRDVADIGCGTGIFTALLLARGHRVVGIEPVDELRELATHRLVGVAGFTSIAGTAEDTTLADQVVDVVTVASAMHWFDVEAVRAEFRRILRDPGWVVTLWNFRTSGDTDFGAAFDALWREVLGPSPAAGRSEIENSLVPAFFRDGAFERAVFANPLACTADQLVGLAASSSHAPARDSSEWAVLEQQLRHLHRDHRTEGVVQVPYETVMYWGCLL
jgi:SAM-dependent methyltransferase